MGRRGGIYKDKKRWEGGKERSCAASRGPEQWWQQGSPGGCMVDPTRPVSTRARACDYQETGPSHCDAPIRPPQAGNMSSGHGPEADGGNVNPAGGLLWKPMALSLANSLRIAEGCGDFASLLQHDCISSTRLFRPHRQCPGTGLGQLSAKGTFRLGMVL